MPAVEKPKQRRNRPTLSCLNCKRKKIKCDRKQPCSNCIKSCCVSSCTYNDNNFGNVKPDVCEIKTTPTMSPNNDTNHNLNFSKSSTPSILEFQFLVSKRAIIYQKPSNTQLRPPLFSAYSKTHLMTNKFITSFMHVLKAARSLWKSKAPTKQIHIQDIEVTNQSQDAMNKLNKRIEQLICVNYNAILERLNYFQSHLNAILLDSCVPMGVVQLIFQHYFTLKPNGAVFNYPENNYEYAMIALLASIVELCNIFFKNDNFDFNFTMIQQINDFNELAVLLLNTSNFSRKKSLFSVYTLLILRLSLFIYGDSQSTAINKQNPVTLFRNAVNICIDMGVHMDQDQVLYTDNLSGNSQLKNIAFAREISIEQIKRLWNYLLKLDCDIFISRSQNPTIDTRYCHGYYSEIHGASEIGAQYTEVVYKVADQMLSNKSITLNEIFDSISELTSLLIKLPPLESFIEVAKHEAQWSMFLLKFRILKLIFTCQFQINAMLDDENLSSNFPQLIVNDEHNKFIIDGLKYEGSKRCKLIYILASNTFSEMSQAFLKPKFMFYNREIFFLWTGMDTISFVDLVFITDEEKNSKLSVQNKEFQSGPKLKPPPVFNIANLEDILLDFNIDKHSKALMEFDNKCKPESIVSYFTKVYTSMLNLEVLLSEYRFFVLMKCFLFLLYFLYSYIKFYYDENFNIATNFDKIKHLTESVMTKLSQRGSLTSSFKPDQLMADIQKTKTDNEGNVEMKPLETESNNMPSISTGNLIINWTPGFSDQFSSLDSQLNDVASSMFDDETMLPFFNDIDEIFNQQI